MSLVEMTIDQSLLRSLQAIVFSLLIQGSYILSVKKGVKMAEQKRTLSKITDFFVITMVALMSIGANLPDTVSVALDKRYLMAGLIGIVAVSLVRYLKFTLVLVVAIMMIGANLPAKMAGELGINTNIMMLALIVMVLVSLGNRLFKIPTGIEQKKTSSSHGASALFNAIAKGRMSTVRTLISQGVNANLTTKEGYTPLIFAASKGFGDMVQMLIEKGANVHAKDKSGKTALIYARTKGFNRVTEILQAAGAKN